MPKFKAVLQHLKETERPAKTIFLFIFDAPDQIAAKLFADNVSAMYQQYGLIADKERGYELIVHSMDSDD